MIDGSMTFTAVREADSGEITGIQMFAQSGHARWTSRLFSPREFVEHILASGIFPPVEADNLYRRLREHGQIEENVALTEERMQVLGLLRSE